MTQIVEGREIVKRMELDGLKLSIEVDADGFRSGTNSKGEQWSNKVHSAYGYILGTNSPDGEHLDVWVKKNAREGKPIFVVHQLTPDGSQYDEDKVMLGFDNADSAIAAFKREAFKPEKMFGGYSEFDIEHFKVIAYSASNSKAMLASQKMYDKFEQKGLLPKGIKSPIQVSQIVKESINMLHITYTSMLVAESAFELAHGAGLHVFKSNKDVMFESENDLRSFMQFVDEAQLDSAHLGDLYEALPDNMGDLNESNMSDAIDDLKSELKAGDDGLSVADSIAKDYGLPTQQLIQAFENAVKMSVAEFVDHKNSQRVHRDKQQKEIAMATKPHTAKIGIVKNLIEHIRGLINQGVSQSDALVAALEHFGISIEEGRRLIPAIKREWNVKESTNESADLLKLAGVKSVVAEATRTPMVNVSRDRVIDLNENHTNAIRAFMLSYASKKSQTLAESISGVDLDAALRRLANTFLMHPQAPTTNIVEAVAGAAVQGDSRALVEHVGTVTGLGVDDFRAALTQRVWENNRITKQIFESLLETTEQKWNIDCPDRGIAFKLACK